MQEIHPDTRIGAVALTISNMERSLAYYQESLGFQLHERNGNVARLGAGAEDLLILHEAPDAPRPGPRDTGLYHFAILVPSRRHLALSLRQLADSDTPLDGYADHLVSEALYLSDPDGNGIEIYRDRPREEWPMVGGNLRMANDPLDFAGIMGELAGRDEPWQGLDEGTTIGHMHLKVSQIPPTEHFFQDILGITLMARYGNMASFLGAGGYHHHIGANTWHSAGGPPPPAGAIGLRWFEIVLPDETALSEVLERLEAAGVPVQAQSGGYIVEDPSQNKILLREERLGD